MFFRFMLSKLGFLAIAASLCVIAPSSGAFAQASDGASDAGSEEEATPRRCMRTADVDDFHVFDRNHVLLIDRRETTFLLAEMHPGCWDIARAPGIALQHRTSNICQGDTATLLVMRTLQSTSERCHVTRITAVGSMSEAEALIENQAEEGENTE